MDFPLWGTGDKQNLVGVEGKDSRAATLHPQGNPSLGQGIDISQRRRIQVEITGGNRISLGKGKVHDYFLLVNQTTKLAAIPDIIREIIESQEQARFDRAHFKEYGDFALGFEIVYYVLVPDYNTYMDTQQAINLAVYERFEKEGISFAYPTQTLYVSAEQRAAIPELERSED